MIRLAVTLIAALTLTGTATAATPIYWTPTKMAAALTALQYPPSSEQVWKTACKGSTVARHGTYAGFRCTVTYYGHRTATVWAKPLAAGRVCASTANLKSCRVLAKGPLAGDPTVCSVNRPDDCARAAAEAAINAHGMQVNLVCAQGATIYVWSCTSTGGSYMVKFTRGATAWKTTVTP